VVRRLQAAGFTFNPDKAVFGASEIKYLGHLVSRRGVKILPDRVAAVANYPHPVNLRALRRFIGMVGFCARFVPNFGDIAAPLYNLKKNGVPFEWNDSHQRAFERLKRALCEAPDFSKDFVLATALHSLIINERDDAEDILEFLNHKLVLRKLIFKDCNFCVGSSAFLAKIVEFYPDLEGLSLIGCCPLTSDCYGHILELEQLSELHLIEYEGLSGETLRRIADSCRKLEKLTLQTGEQGQEQSDEQDVIYVISILGEQLTTLSLSGGNVTDVTYLYLNNCTRLQELELICCKNMTDTGLRDGIAALNNLTSLTLTFCMNLSTHAWSTLLNRSSMSSILMLQLVGNDNLNNEGLTGIAQKCKHLDISQSKSVTEDGIVMVIQECRQLRVINVSGIQNITGEKFLPLVPSFLPHLRKLCLNWCHKLLRKCKEKLQAAAPKLEVTTVKCKYEMA
jgi:hypothetical protein